LADRNVPAIDIRTFGGGLGMRDNGNLKEAANIFLKQGCLLIHNAFEPKYIQRLHDDFVKEYAHYFVDNDFNDALSVGNKRTMLTVEIKNSFNTYEFYANPKIFPLLKYLLSDDLILGSVGSVVSLPGAENQHVHRDHPNIYDTGLGYEGSDNPLQHGAPYAITLVIPLIPINKKSGSTKVWPGTHISDEEPSHVEASNGIEHSAELGSCFLMDYRLIHGGMANNSDAIRPILYNIYSRPWFRDYRNYNKQSPLKISDDQFNQVPNAFSSLFEWRKKETRSP